MKQHTAAIAIAAVMAAGVMVTVTTAAVAAVKALRESARDMAAEAIQTAAMAEKLIQYTERQEG